mgnify:CR=1 FL=1
MKVPVSPPSQEKLLELLKSGDVAKMALLFGQAVGPTDSKGRYLHWDKLRHLAMPKGYDAELYWLAMRNAREKISRDLSFKDKQGAPFRFCIPDTVILEGTSSYAPEPGEIRADTVSDNDK